MVVACSEIPASLQPSPSGGGGFVPVLVSNKAASSVTTTTFVAPNKRELMAIDNVTATTTLHTILIGADLYTEVSGVGWEQTIDPGFNLTPVFALNAIFGSSLATALRTG